MASGGARIACKWWRVRLQLCLQFVASTFEVASASCAAAIVRNGRRMIRVSEGARRPRSQNSGPAALPKLVVLRSKGDAEIEWSQRFACLFQWLV